MHAVHETETRCSEVVLGIVEAEFAGQLATSVWLGKLTDDAAREALWSYALACRRGKRWAEALCETLVAEYRRRRRRQDACG